MILLKSQDLLHGLTRAAQMACMVAILSMLSPLAAFAQGDDAISEHIAAAEDALKNNDFWRASSEYRKAAELSDDSDIAKQATRIAYTYGFNEDALASAKRWVALDDSDDEALLYLALLELRDGDIKSSRNEFKKLLQRGDEPADERLISLIPFLSDENAADADALMRQLSKPYKKSPYAHYAAAVLALYANDSDEALKRAKRATELKPDWLKPQLLYARALLMSGDEEGAIDYTARLVGDNPDPDPEARLELAIMYLSAGRDDDALSQINQVLLEQPARTDALRLMAIINFRLEHLDAARQDFEDLLSTGQYTMDAFYYLARIADHLGERKRAIALYSKVTQGDNAVFSQRRVSAILASEDEFELAQKHLENFGRLHPIYAVDMIQAQAQLLASQELFEEAITYFDRVIKYRPDSESAFLGKAELLLAMDRVDDAVVAYREAVQRWPDSAISLNALGYTLTDRTDEHKEAARLIRKAMKLDPDSAAIIDSHGWVLYRLGEYEDALVELERAYEQLEDPEVAAHIIEVLWKLERQDEAMQRLVDAEELWPESSLLENVRTLVAPEG
jgi:tetratricopeptide (TPR) repeat protein